MPNSIGKNCLLPNWKPFPVHYPQEKKFFGWSLKLGTTVKANSKVECLIIRMKSTHTTFFCNCMLPCIL